MNVKSEQELMGGAGRAGRGWGWKRVLVGRVRTAGTGGGGCPTPKSAC